MAENNDTNWDYEPDEPAAAPAGSGGAFAWEAPEYIEHHHGFGWYLALVILTAGAAAAVFFISAHDIVATVIVALLGVTVGVFASHKPAVAKYQINSSGLGVNAKSYRFGDYKSFTVAREGELSSLNFTPIKRLMPPLAAYYDPKDEKKILDALGDRLPYEARRPDAIDRLAHRLRL